MNRQAIGVNCLPEFCLTLTLTLICAGATRFSRSGGFAGPEESLDDAGRRAAVAAMAGGRFDRLFCSPARSAMETAAVMALPVEPEIALRDLDHGAWSGRTIMEVGASHPDGLAAWLADPAAGAPDGEDMANAAARIGPWIDSLAGQASGRLGAITHPMMIRVALAHMLDLPLRSTLAIDIAPLSFCRLSFNRAWRLQALGAPPIDSGGKAKAAYHASADDPP